MSQPRPDWYLAQNPIGGVPTLDDDGLVLAESNAILRYLAQRERREDLYPVAPAERARVDEFLDRFSLSLRGAFFQVERLALGFVQGVGFEAGPPDLEGARAKAAEIAGTLQLFDGLVADNGTVLGTLHDRRLRGRSRAVPYAQHRHGPRAVPAAAAAPRGGHGPRRVRRRGPRPLAGRSQPVRTASAASSTAPGACASCSPSTPTVSAATAGAACCCVRSSHAPHQIVTAASRPRTPVTA